MFKQEPVKQPCWYTPHRLVAYFCLVLLMTWIDQGLVASNQVTGNDDNGNPLGFKKLFNLNGFKLGVLPACYAVGLIIAGFISSHLAMHINSFRLIGVGMLCWTLGVVLTGASTSYGMLIAARILAGCGEAPLLTLTFTFVDDVAPRASATLWFGVLGLAPVLGIGAGYVLAEPLTSAAGGSGSSTGLRWAFFIEALVSMPLTAFALFAPAVHLNMATSTPPPKPATARSVAASPSSATPTAANPTTTTTPGTPASVGTLATGLVPPPLSLPFAGGGDGGVREGAGASASSGSGAPITAQLQGSRRYPGGIRGCTACGGNLLSESATAAGDTSTSTSGRPLHPPPPPRPAGKCEHVDLDPAAVVGAVSYTKLEGGQTHTPVSSSNTTSRASPWWWGWCGGSTYTYTRPRGPSNATGRSGDGGGDGGGDGSLALPLAVGCPQSSPLDGPSPHHEACLRNSLCRTCYCLAARPGGGGEDPPAAAVGPSGEGEGEGEGRRVVQRFGGSGDGSLTHLPDSVAVAVGDDLVDGGDKAYGKGSRSPGRRRRCLGPSKGEGQGVAAVAGGVRGPWGVGAPWELLRYPANCFNSFGYAPVQWIFGMVSFWAPKAAQEIFRLRGSGPEFLIGVIAVVSGVLGTLAGGVLLDRWGSSLENGFRLQTVAVAGALVFMQLAFLAARSFTVFCVLLSAGLISLFAVQAPSYALSMWTVPLRYRPISQAAIILLQHALGDVPSPPATVALHDAFKLGGSSGNGGRSSGREWRLSLALSSAYLGFAVVLFGAGTLLARRGRALDFRLQQQQGQEGEGEHGQDEREEVDESQMLCGVCGRRAG